MAYDPASEITQETFIRAFQAIAKYDSRRPFSAWLFTIARNMSINALKKKLPLKQNA